MKCPKCGYLGFEPADRCRNCGYDFSFAPSLELPELPMRSAPDLNPLDDLSLIDAAVPLDAPALPRHVTPDLDAGSRAVPSQRVELPLFGAPGRDDVPLITRSSPPRPPLAVRRATPEVPRLRVQPLRTPMLDLGEIDPPTLASLTPAARAVSADEWSTTEAGRVEPAGLGARFAAATLDLSILAAVDAVVVYFTMQICGLTAQDLSVLPKGPLVAFLLVQNGGYFVVFTVGGQTLGKMAARIKVVPARTNAPLDVGHSILRTLVWALLAVPAGLGFLTALFSRDHRGLHDRCAGTRVVRVSA